MNNYLADSSTRTGTVGGLLMVLIMQIDGVHLLNTALTAATGALVSFLVAITCKYFCTRLIVINRAVRKKRLYRRKKIPFLKINLKK